MFWFFINNFRGHLIKIKWNQIFFTLVLLINGFCFCTEKVSRIVSSSSFFAIDWFLLAIMRFALLVLLFTGKSILSYFAFKLYSIFGLKILNCDNKLIDLSSQFQMTKCLKSQNRTNLPKSELPQKCFFLNFFFFLFCHFFTYFSSFFIRFISSLLNHF